MKNKMLNSVGSALSLLVLLGGNNARACGSGSDSTTIFPLPTLGGFFSDVSGLNLAGQATGFSQTTGNTASHGFFFSSGTTVDIGTLNGNFSQGNAINAAGTVAGLSDNEFFEIHAVKYEGGSLLDLGTLGGFFSSGNAINDAGVVAGDSINADGNNEAFIYNGSMTGLGNLGGGSSTGVAINQGNSVIGNSSTADFQDHGYIYQSGSMTDLGTLGGNYSLAAALSDANIVVGESSVANGDVHAFVWQSGSITDLGTFGGIYSSAWGLNTNNQIIGEASIAGETETHAFVYSSGTLTDLGTLGGNFSSPSAINNLGQIVGVSANTNGDNHAFMWQNGTLTDLNSLLPANSGWVLFNARFITDAGLIVGSGEFNGTPSTYFMQLGTAVNHAPVAVAGQNQSISCNGVATLDGSASTDADSDPLSYEWSENNVVLGTNVTLQVNFGLGSHTVKLKVSDPCGDFSEATTEVSVTDSVAPSFQNLPGALGLSVGASCTAILPDLTALVTATDDCSGGSQISVTQSPIPGTVVTKGPLQVTFTAQDASGNSASTNVTVNVTDSTAPSISSSPAPLTIPVGTSCSATVPSITATIGASDNCTAVGQLVITQNPVAGTSISKGTHTIQVTVTDESGNSTSTSVTLNVVDSTAPQITSAPSTLTVAAGAGCSGTVPNVVGSIIASDNCTAAAQLVITQSPGAGSSVPTGSSTIHVTVADEAGNTSSTSITLNVTDSIAPTISGGSNLTISAGPACSALVPNVLGSITVSDNCTPTAQLVVTQSPAAGTSVAKGSHTITVTVADASGNTASKNLTLNVVDATAPIISTVTATPNNLSPANNKFVDVVVSVNVTDNCDAAPVTQIVSITALGGVPASDMQVTGPLTAKLMASKLNGGDQVYTITVRSTDASGNSSTGTVNVTVPKNSNGDGGKKNK